MVWEAAGEGVRKTLEEAFQRLTPWVQKLAEGWNGAGIKEATWGKKVQVLVLAESRGLTGPQCPICERWRMSHAISSRLSRAHSQARFWNFQIFEKSWEICNLGEQIWKCRPVIFLGVVSQLWQDFSSGLLGEVAVMALWHVCNQGAVITELETLLP